MSDILNKTIVLVLNRNWQAINIRTPQDAFCQMATNVATALDIEGESHIRPVTCMNKSINYVALLGLVAWVRVRGLDRQINSLFMSDGFEDGTVHWADRI
jgi:hypothetical protein